jgi:hypothetical protein
MRTKPVPIPKPLIPDKLGRLIASLGHEMEIREVRIDDLREQSVNPQVLEPKKFERLTENVRGRGMLESLPYTWLGPEADQIQIVSGHHRVRAARAAGQAKVHVLVDRQLLTRSQVVARQIAHNELHGEPDIESLRELAAEMTSVDDMLGSGLDEDFFSNLPATDTVQFFQPQANFDWRTVNLTFLPHQFERFQEIIDHLDGTVNLVGVGAVEGFEEFAKVVANYARIEDIKSVGTTLARLVQMALDEIKAKELLTPDEDGVIDPLGDADPEVWVPLAAVTRSRNIPLSAAQVIDRALDVMMADGDTGIQNRWQALEFLAADYLGGRGV